MYNLDLMRKASDAVDYPIEKCETVTGFFARDLIIDIIPKVEYTRKPSYLH